MIFDFGYRLRELRRLKHMTQTQVAHRLNLSKATISGYENNIKTPSLDMLIQLSKLYDASTDYILGLENRKAIFVDGLTDSQQELILSLAKEFKKSHINKKDNLL